MDIVNYISQQRKFISSEAYKNMHSVLQKNYEHYRKTDFLLDDMISALKKDKKNTGSALSLILPVGDSVEIKKVEVLADNLFYDQCSQFLDQIRK